MRTVSINFCHEFLSSSVKFITRCISISLGVADELGLCIVLSFQFENRGGVAQDEILFHCRAERLKDMSYKVTLLSGFL